jgi:hypothetical protein
VQLTKAKGHLEKVKIAVGVFAAAGVMALAASASSPDGTKPQFSSAPGDGGPAEEAPAKPMVTETETTTATPRKRAPAKSSQSLGQAAGAPAKAAPAEPSPPTTTAAPVSQPVVPTESPNTGEANRSRNASQEARSDSSPAPQAPTTPSGVTTAQVRALPGAATIQAVAARLGPSTSLAEMTEKYGDEAVRELASHEVPGTICRYYAVSGGLPAPFVRICFDANGRMISRDFVAPRG